MVILLSHPPQVTCFHRQVAKLDVDENPETASRYRIQSIPTMLFFKDGRLVNRVVGALPKQEIERHISNML